MALIYGWTPVKIDFYQAVMVAHPEACMMKISQLPIPDFFEEDHTRIVSKLWHYRPDISRLFSEAATWRRKYNIPSTCEQERDILLLGIDIQRDFCLPEGALFVAGRSGKGAVHDCQRTAELIYRNINIITRIKLTLDTHTLFQIFFAPFWVTKQGDPLSENTMIRISDGGGVLVNADPAGNIIHSDVRPNPAIAAWVYGNDYEGLCKQVRFYCKKLAETGKYTLYLWPPHCLLGTEGHTIAGVVQEAVMFHNLVRNAEPLIYTKGEAVLTENYDPAEVEVHERWDGKEDTARRRDNVFYKDLCKADALIVLGQAASHCVASMLDGLMNEVSGKDPGLLKKIYVVTDCMSAVTVKDPEGRMAADFTPDAETALARFSAAGMHLVESTTPVHDWPGIMG